MLILVMLIMIVSTGCVPEEITVDLPGGEKMDFVWIEPGTFVMGSPAVEPERNGDEGPQHQVTISRGFYLGKQEVTQGQWAAVMETRPWAGKRHIEESARNAASFLKWVDVQEFIRRLNQAAGEEIFRLPREAEWEYACRAGTTTRWSFGDDGSKVSEYAWYRENAWEQGEKFPHVTGLKLPNPWGLYDMHGNVWEWCQDWYGKYSQASQTDPIGPESGSLRVARGGHFTSHARFVRSAARLSHKEKVPSHAIGVRLLREHRPSAD